MSSTIKRVTVFLVALALSVPMSSRGDAATAPIAHAHNDYLRERPLTDALEHGFTSIEVDIFTSANQFLVAHKAAELSDQRSLTELYLDPLDRMARDQTLNRDVTLVLDAKSVPAERFGDLDELLSHYSGIISPRDGHEQGRGGVTVLLSSEDIGEQVAKVGAAGFHYFAIEGRLSDLGAAADATVMPQVAANWRKNFTWRGRGKMPKKEKELLATIVARAHAERRRLRFWNTPDDTTVWRALTNAGVDVIGTDDLARLEAFLRPSAGNVGN